MKIIISVAGKFHVFNLAQELNLQGHLLRLITSYPKSELKKFGIPPEKVRTVLIKEIMQRAWWKLPAGVKSLWNPQYLIHEIYDKIAARKIEPADIVTGGSFFFLHTLREAKKRGAITVVDHGSSHILYQTKILKEEYERFGVRVLPFQLAHPKLIEKGLREYEEADYISIPSLFTKRTFLENGIPEKKIIQVPYGVNLSAFRQIPKTDKVFRVVFAGGMSLRKGTHYLLQAFSELNLPNSELMLVGSMNDEMKPFFKKYEGHFNYVGHIPSEELYKYYSQGSVFVMPSLEEGLSMVQAQAMACGLPLICTTNTGGEDIIREGKDGFVIPIRSVDAIKEKILYFYEHPGERDRMGLSAKEYISGRFTWHEYGEGTAKAYERILAEKKGIKAPGF